MEWLKACDLLPKLFCSTREEDPWHKKLEVTAVASQPCNGFHLASSKEKGQKSQ